MADYKNMLTKKIPFFPAVFWIVSWWIVSWWIVSWCIVSLIPGTVGFASAEPMLLSDRVIEQIKGRSGVVTNLFESPSTADVPDTDMRHFFWGDQDGLPGAPRPGSVVIEFPYDNFQWQNFRYRFPDEETAEAFKAGLIDRTPARPTATALIKSNPSADTIFLDDGTAPKVIEVIVTTDRKVPFHLVNHHGGSVIEEPARFELSFDEPQYHTKKRYKKITDPVYNRPTRAYTYSFDGIAVDDIYEWRTYHYGAVSIERDETGAAPIQTDTGREIVPANTPYLKNTLSSGIRIHSPRFGVSVGLAPAGKPFQPAHWALDGQNHFPDMSRYQILGNLDIENLSIHITGGNPIYVYPH